jgi:hypothetical protein
MDVTYWALDGCEGGIVGRVLFPPPTYLFHLSKIQFYP